MARYFAWLPPEDGVWRHFRSNDLSQVLAIPWLSSGNWKCLAEGANSEATADFDEGSMHVIVELRANSCASESLLSVRSGLQGAPRRPPEPGMTSHLNLPVLGAHSLSFVVRTNQD